MNDQASPNSSPSSTVVVPVDIVVGTKTLSLEQLSTIREGHVIEWDGEFPTSARLMVGNREIGSGRIVRVGDHLGVVVESIRP